MLLFDNNPETFIFIIQVLFKIKDYNIIFTRIGYAEDQKTKEIEEYIKNPGGWQQKYG